MQFIVWIKKEKYLKNLSFIPFSSILKTSTNNRDNEDDDDHHKNEKETLK